MTNEWDPVWRHGNCVDSIRVLLVLTRKTTNEASREDEDEKTSCQKYQALRCLISNHTERWKQSIETGSGCHAVIDQQQHLVNDRLGSSKRVQLFRSSIRKRFRIVSCSNALRNKSPIKGQRSGVAAEASFGTEASSICFAQEPSLL